MRHSPFVNSSTESIYVFLVSDYIGPLWKLNRKYALLSSTIDPISSSFY